MNLKLTAKTFAAASLAAATLAVSARAEEAEDFSRWYFTPSIGYLNFEGDQPLEDGFFLNVRLGYDLNEWWGLEGGLFVAPKLDENLVDGDGAFVHRNPDGSWERRSEQGTHSKGKDRYFGDTWAAGLYADALFHFTRWERLDPFLAGGLGLNIYGKDVLDDGRTELVLRAGGGVMWHFSDVWAVRGDFRLLLDTDNTEFNNEIDVGIVWNWDAGAQPEFVAVAGPVDTDGDGLTDDYEMQIGTDPNNPDTDGDGLTDGAEVLKYKTDPLNPDSDFDGLKDGAEVFKYKTDPLDPDTDKGGVTDGHEVLVDKTDPLNGNDDLLRFELHLLFDYDKADIKAKDYPDLDTVAKVLARNPGATATIEGHADRKFASKAEYNRRLSERRATAVKNYFIHKGIDASRLRAVGYGFDRPKVKPDLKNGTPENRRVEVYIRGADERGISDALKAK
ncbi:MAG: OmpA family protein [Kiritimatiellae bacterium]|nr:OmpA family protein [Kiritimatiellia bacterium]